MIKKNLLSVMLFGCLLTHNAHSQSLDANRYGDVYKKYLNADCPIQQDNIKHFVYFSRDRELIHDHPLLEIQRFDGAQIMYSWKQLEPRKGEYDFSTIREDYNFLLSHKKKLYIQLQDATFDVKYKGVPEYLLSKEYDGGITRQGSDGWVAKRWNVKVQERFALLLEALGREFDGKIEGINLQETSIEVNSKTDSTFSPERYTRSVKANMLALKKAFQKSVTIQYANFMPGEWLPWDDKGYLRSIYQYGQEIGVGLGGPDLMVQKKGQLNHALAMMREGKFTVPLGIAIQDGNYIGETNNLDAIDKHNNLVSLLHAFAQDFLKVDYMFWVNQEPYFKDDVISCFRLE